MQEQKLLPEHIVGYLPFELEVIIKNTKVVLTTIHKYSIQTSPSVHRFTHCSYHHFKPILRKLSSITSEELKLFTIDFQMSYESPLFDYNLIPFCDIQTCCRLHLDYQDLIGSGLAIDKYI